MKRSSGVRSSFLTDRDVIKNDMEKTFFTDYPFPVNINSFISPRIPLLRSNPQSVPEKIFGIEDYPLDTYVFFVVFNT
jgi:hypothetical protein